MLVYCSNYKCSPRSRADPCAAFGLQDRLLCRQRSICQYFRAGLESTSMKPCRQRWAIIFFSKFPPILFLVIVRRMYAGDFSKPWHPHAPGAGVLFGRSALSPETRLPAALLCTDRRNHRPCKSVRKNRLGGNALIRCAGLLVCSADYLHIVSRSAVMDRRIMSGYLVLS